MDEKTFTITQIRSWIEKCTLLTKGQDVHLIRDEDINEDTIEGSSEIVDKRQQKIDF